MDLLDSRQAADFLGVEPETLYAYVSRGILESVEDPDDARRRCYRRSDLERLVRRRDATRGHGPAAANALDWGAPVLETSISEIRPTGPSYRGTSLRRLTDAGASFEETVELLWTGESVNDAERWETARREADALLADGLDIGPSLQTPPVDLLRHAASTLALRDRRRHTTTREARLRLARRLLRGLARAFVATVATGPAPPDPGESIAAFVATRLGGLPVATVETALVTVAEHGLNASSFACRVTASTDADPYACATAALAAMAGPQHGRATDHGRQLLGDALRADEPGRPHLKRLRDGRPTPTFGHRLYPGGDPRYRLLVDTLRETVGDDDHGTIAAADALAGAADELDLGAPNLACGLAVLARVGEWPTGSASGLFALGRTAGWIAHALEQYERGQLLRPRAEYLGA